MNTLDINIYFIDKFNRLCVLASAGGTLPQYLLTENELNTNSLSFLLNREINNNIYRLPKNFSTRRNPILPSILKYQYPNSNNDNFNSNDNEDYNFTTRYDSELSRLIKEGISTELDDSEYSDYFSTFDDLAARGFFVYDKLNINHPEDDNFVLVSYPIIDKYNYKNHEYKKMTNNFLEKFPVLTSWKSSLPKLNIPLTIESKGNFRHEIFERLNLIKLIDSI
ncbi:hypothetical protein [Acinetobacter soli]